MRPGRPGPWTENTKRAGLDRTHAHAARLRALSCVSGVGVRVSLGASKSPANQCLSPLWGRNLDGARQPSCEHRECSHACGGNDLTTFAWSRPSTCLRRAARACGQQVRRGLSTQSRRRRLSLGPSPLSSTPSAYRARRRQGSESPATLLLLAPLQEWPEREHGPPLVVQTRRATGTERGARIVYLSGSDGRPVGDPSLSRLRSSCISASTLSRPHGGVSAGSALTVAGSLRSARRSISSARTSRAIQSR
jgi:hypothetical protein